MALENLLETSVALAARKAGSQAALRRVLGVPQSTLSSWLRRGTELPAKYVLQVEKALGIPRHELRPDIYPPEEARLSLPIGLANQPLAQHPAAHPSAPVETSPPSTTGVDGPGPALDYPSCADPLKGKAA